MTQNGTAVKTYGYTDSTWGDLLTSFNGQTITYDEIGNPLQYRDGMSFTWAKGRQLQGITKDGLNASYTYDENGLRISKTVNGITTKIFRTNGQPVGMNMSDGKDVTFILDGDGNVYGVHYDHYSFDQLCSATYYFAFNAQGDVIGIYDFDGRMIATYDYDEWGNCTVHALSTDRNGHEVDSPDHVAYVNPFRYRGYFYDAETGFYYLNSRYYDPGTGRFINSDNVVSGTGESVQGYNTFAYCFNNPVNLSDENGNWPVLAIIVAVTAAVVAVATVVNHVINAVNNRKINKEIKSSYTKEEATEEINRVLTKYDTDNQVSFNEKSIKITNSYKVRRYDRQKICKIITRTEEIDVNREFDNMSSEWLFHNITYDLHIRRGSTQDVDIEYLGDDRPVVYVPTKVLEILGWE